MYKSVYAIGLKSLAHAKGIFILISEIGCYKQLTYILLVDLSRKVNGLKSGH